MITTSKLFQVSPSGYSALVGRPAPPASVHWHWRPAGEARQRRWRRRRGGDGGDAATAATAATAAARQGFPRLRARLRHHFDSPENDCIFRDSEGDSKRTCAIPCRFTVVVRAHRLRSRRHKHWPRYLSRSERGVNHRPPASLARLSPRNIQSPGDSVVNANLPLLQGVWPSFLHAAWLSNGGAAGPAITSRVEDITRGLWRRPRPWGLAPVALRKTLAFYLGAARASGVRNAHRVGPSISAHRVHFHATVASACAAAQSTPITRNFFFRARQFYFR
jgi:hypothetical protein